MTLHRSPSVSAQDEKEVIQPRDQCSSDHVTGRTSNTQPCDRMSHVGQRLAQWVASQQEGPVFEPCLGLSVWSWQVRIIAVFKFAPRCTPAIALDRGPGFRTEVDPQVPHHGFVPK